MSMEDMDPTEDDEFWESSSTHWCGASCRYTVAPALAIGTLVNAALTCILARRNHPMAANEMFMFAILLNDLIYSSSFLCDYYIFGSFIQSLSSLRDPIWFCRLRFLLYESSKVASLALPALFALHEASARNRCSSTSPLASFIFRHRMSLVVDLSIICILLSTPIFFVIGQRRSSETCSFLFYKIDERAISIIGMICSKIRFCLLVASLVILWIATVYLYIKVTSVSGAVTARLANFWSEQKLLNCLTIKSTLLVTPFAVMMEIRVLHVVIPLWLEDICDMALLFNFISSAPIFLILYPDLRFWRDWRCCVCTPICRTLRNSIAGGRRKSYQDQRQQPTAGADETDTLSV